MGRRGQALEDVSYAMPATLAEERERWFEETMARAGVRNTMPRRLIRRLFARATSPLSVQDILHRSQGEIHLVTVYRTVAEMVRLGLLNRVEFEEGFARYEAAACPSEKEHRHHVVCNRCGQVADFAGCVIEQALPNIRELDGFHVERHTLTLYGTCATCQGQTNRPIPVSECNVLQNEDSQKP
jgi:Fur family ferric uptake transcriptional regulator